MNSLHASPCAIACLLVLGSCVQVKMHELPAFEAASNLGGPDHALVFFDSDDAQASLPVAVPFAGVALLSGGTLSRSTLAKYLKEMETGYKPDYYLATDFRKREGATVTGQSDFMWFRVPPNGEAYLLAFAYRVCPSDIGVVWNEYSMITDITNPSLLEAGLLEGDSITAINGAAVSFGMDSPSHIARLGINPGETFALRWIRSGVGKMEGTGVALENPNNVSTLADGVGALLEEEAQKRREREY